MGEVGLYTGTGVDEGVCDGAPLTPRKICPRVLSCWSGAVVLNLDAAKVLLWRIGTMVVLW